MADVARQARVGVMTASRVLNKSANVSEDLRERVLQAAELLDYVPHASARALASSASRAVYLVTCLNDVVWAEQAVKVLASGLERVGLTLKVSILQCGGEHDVELLRDCLGHDPAGIILPIPLENSAFIQLLEKARCPVVTLMDVAENPSRAPSGVSPRIGGYEAARHLVEAGYRNIGFIAPTPNWRVMARLEGFTDALKERGLLRRELIAISEKPSSIAVGAEVLARLKQTHTDLDAISCYDDKMAAGALFEAQRMRISVPDELGICGFGGYEVAAECSPRITTLTPDFDQLSTSVIHYFADYAQTGEMKPFEAKAGFSLLLRESTDRHTSKREKPILSAVR